MSSSQIACNFCFFNASLTSLLIYLPSLCLCVFRLLIKNGNNIDSPPVYDSYEVEYLPNEGVLSTGRYLFVEFTTDGTMTSTGAAIRYEGRLIMHIAEFANTKTVYCTSSLMHDAMHFLCPQLSQKGCATSHL